MKAARVVLVIVTGILLIVVLVQQMWYTAHPHRVDFEADMICSASNRAYLLAADDGYSNEKTVSRAKELDKDCKP